MSFDPANQHPDRYRDHPQPRPRCAECNEFLSAERAATDDVCERCDSEIEARQAEYNDDAFEAELRDMHRNDRERPTWT